MTDNRGSFFERLGPDAVLDAVESAGLRPTGHTTPLMCLENRVFDVRLEDERHVVVKFYRPERWSREAILEEHRLLFDLREAEIPVCAPLPFPDRTTLAEAGGIFFAVWPRTGGRSPDELSDDALRILGRLLARIHNVGAAREAPHRPVLDAERFGLAPLRFLEEQGFLPALCARRYRAAVERVVALHAERAAGVPLHRIHGDCHRGNLLLGREGFFFLDFDDFVTGPAVHDVWMLVPGRDLEGDRQRKLLVEAYREFRPFEDRWLELVETLRALRFVGYAAWIARRSDDPAFRDAFPHFGTDEYWERETRDLEEQLDRILGEKKPEAPVHEERDTSQPASAELTNKDFFWDLE